MNNKDLNDFGFTTEPEIEMNKMLKIEELIIPLLDSLIESADNAKINWPNRREPLQKLKENILKITRSV